MVEFAGMDPWPAGIEVVECVTGGGIVDLHNDCTLTAVEITCTPLVDVVLRFVRDADALAAALTFHGATDLRFRQDDRDATSPSAAAWDPGEVATFHGAEYVPEGGPAARFRVETITGELTFRCSRVSLTMRAST